MTINGNQIQAVVAMGVARQTAEKALATGATTDNIPEGSVNLYFTTARGRNVLAANTPLSYNSGTGTFSIQKGTTSQNGYISSTDWNTFNGKANAFTGYTGSVVVVTGVNFAGQTVTTQTLTYSNGILTGVA